MTAQWRPTSCDEAAWFQDSFCGRCTKDAAFRAGTGDSCTIAAQGYGVALGLEPPPEWVEADGEPRCTAFDAEAGA